MNSAEYCCPRCKGTLSSLPDAYVCALCNVRYPVVLGIPDFRVFPDPYIDIAEDHKKAGRIAERATESDFRALVEYYWSITPEEPPEMAQRFTIQALAAVDRGRHLLDGQAMVSTRLQRGSIKRALDLGSRTGGLLLAAAERADHVVGIDIAFRWLIIARKRLEEAGRPAQLVCCCAEFLPFRESAFDLVLAENVLEHTAQQQQCIEEAHRVLKPGGVFFATTWNRLAVAPEPHVRLWGVGWLPLGLAKRYVKMAQRRELRSRPAALGLPVGAHGPAHSVSAVRDRVANIQPGGAGECFSGAAASRRALPPDQRLAAVPRAAADLWSGVAPRVCARAAMSDSIICR